MKEEGIYPPNLLTIEKVKQIVNNAVSNSIVFNESFMFRVSGVIEPPESERKPYHLVNPDNPGQFLSLGYTIPEKIRKMTEEVVTLIVTPVISVGKDGSAAYINYQIRASMDGPASSERESLLKKLREILKNHETSPFYTTITPHFEKAPSKVYAIVSQSGLSSIFSDIIKQVDSVYRGLVDKKTVSVKDPMSIAKELDSADCEDNIIILARGGGNKEDLDAFNNAAVIEAISRNRAYVITAVGHAEDVTLADLVSDARMSTPSDAGMFLNKIFKETDPFLKDNTQHEMRAVKEENNQLQIENSNLKRQLKESQSKANKSFRFSYFLLGGIFGVIAFCCIYFGYHSAYHSVNEFVNRLLP